jgi:hypothetical protein
MECIRCGKAPTMSPAAEVCGSCRVTLKQEIQSGLKRFSRYLENWGAFRDFEEQED